MAKASLNWELKVVELKEMCRVGGLKVSGSKAELVDRLKVYQRQEAKVLRQQAKRERSAAPGAAPTGAAPAPSEKRAASRGRPAKQAKVLSQQPEGAFSKAVQSEADAAPVAQQIEEAEPVEAMEAEEEVEAETAGEAAPVAQQVVEAEPVVEAMEAEEEVEAETAEEAAPVAQQVVEAEPVVEAMEAEEEVEAETAEEAAPVAQQVVEAEPVVEAMEAEEEVEAETAEEAAPVAQKVVEAEPVVEAVEVDKAEHAEVEPAAAPAEQVEEAASRTAAQDAVSPTQISTLRCASPEAASSFLEHTYARLLAKKEADQRGDAPPSTPRWEPRERTRTPRRDSEQGTAAAPPAPASWLMASPTPTRSLAPAPSPSSCDARQRGASVRLSFGAASPAASRQAALADGKHRMLQELTAQMQSVLGKLSSSNGLDEGSREKYQEVANSIKRQIDKLNNLSLPAYSPAKGVTAPLCSPVSHRRGGC